MRLLSNEEIDSIFGGEDNYIQTMDTVTVTASRIQTSGGYYLPGLNGFVKEETSGGCGWCTAYYASMYSALPTSQVPSYERLKCLGAATAPADRGLLASFTLQILNTRVYRHPELSNSVTSFIHRPRNGHPGSGYTQEIGGLTSARSDGGGMTYIYAGGMQSGAYKTGTYINPVTGEPQTFSGSLTASENMVFTLIHEAHHQRNAFTPANEDEQSADGWGWRAVLNLRDGAGANCPAT